MRGFLILMTLVLVASCGVKGDPVPPGDPTEEAETDERYGDEG